MRRRSVLPPTLGATFTVRAAAAAGVGRGRAAAADLHRPFHGVRSLTPQTTPLHRVFALASRLRPGQLIGGATAMRVWGYPVPGSWKVADDIDVVVATDAVRPRTRGVRSRRLATGRAQLWWIGRVPVVDPLTALFLCVASFTDDELVVALDALVTTANNYPGLRADRPLHTVEEIDQRLRHWGRFAGCARVRAALPAVRASVESPKETETRLLLVAAGLPEPVVQHEIRRDGVIIARSDLAYPELRIAVEYEGDGHRTDRDQWRRDIQRQRELEDIGWIVIRVTQLDLDDGGRMLLDRIRRAIASRS
ncbi:hypothetical protein LJR186_003222 [Microbacterium foliorum]